MTAIQEMIEIIKQKRNESEISNTLLRFAQFEAEKLLEKEKKQQDDLAIGFAEWCDDNYFRIGTTSFWAESLFDEKAIAYKTEELLEIYKKKL
jgi:hypothetical protein